MDNQVAQVHLFWQPTWRLSEKLKLLQISRRDAATPRYISLISIPNGGHDRAPRRFRLRTRSRENLIQVFHLRGGELRL